MTARLRRRRGARPLLTRDRSPARRGLAALVTAQFLGALNDNYVKMLVSLLAIEAGLRAGEGSSYLSLTGVVFMTPYLLFSGYAGQLADRCAKRSVLVGTKAAEIGIGLAVLAALVDGRVGPLLAVLFLLAAQSAFFSPAKAGILPEMLPAAALPRANGALELARYLAIIIGTALGGVLLELSGRQPVLLGLVSMAIAVAGWLASLGIARLPPAGAAGPAQRNPWTEIAAGLRRIGADRRLWPLVAATTLFDFVSSLVLLAFLLLTKEILLLGDAGTGLYAAIVGAGLGLGALAAGRLARGRIDLGSVSLAAAGSGLALLALAAAARSPVAAALALAALGLCGGFYVVPLYTALQRRASPTERGRVIATNNLVNMLGVFASAAALWLLHDAAGLATDRILALSGLTMLAVTLVALVTLPEFRPVPAGPAPAPDEEPAGGLCAERLCPSGPEC